MTGTEVVREEDETARWESAEVDPVEVEVGMDEGAELGWCESVSAAEAEAEEEEKVVSVVVDEREWGCSS